MPRFYFDIDDGVRDLRDDDGVPLDDRECARRDAIATLTQLAQDMLPNGNDHVFRARVRDESGELIYEAALTLRSGWVP